MRTVSNYTSSQSFSRLDSYTSPDSLSSFFWSHTTLFTALSVVASLLILEQAVYRSKKGRLPGDKWTIPVIGKFASSLSPTLEGYQAQWDSGELSALSVFNM